MPAEDIISTGIDHQQNVDDPRNAQRQVVGGLADKDPFSMEKSTGNDDNMSTTQPTSREDNKCADDSCTASYEAAPEIRRTTSRDSSATSGSSQETVEDEDASDGIVEQKNTATSKIEHPKQNIENQDDTIRKQHQLSNDIDSLTFIKDKKGRFRPRPEQRLRNNLLASVGFLEFANATDFAANVWNTVPVPKFAAALMGLGGAVALSFVPFAIWDARLCWQNSKMLLQERILLLREAGEIVDEEKGKLRIARQKGLDTRLEVNGREIGTELFDRGSMDLLMGFSAFLVGIGTIMAIGGANRRVYRASNLLSGYIGNSPSTFWGLCNTAWSIYVFKRAQHHLALGQKKVASEQVLDLLTTRIRSVQLHSVLMGSSTLVSAAAGMLTATHWYGYPFLVVCIVIAIFGNWYWRKRLGYDRPLVLHAGHVKMNTESLVQEIEWAASMQASLGSRRKPTVADETFSKPKKFTSVIELMARCDLFEELCECLLTNTAFCSAMEITSEDSIQISPADMAAIGEKHESAVLATAKAVLRERGQRQLEQKQRYLLEMLGASLVEDEAEQPLAMSGKTEKMNEL
ncbi:hypothetical protein FKW77_010020 [Venturia effusa]|uniref:Integral membrane protein n=1 Tax=Venturia effusa TaxID=50376 RepID=A0A517L0B7_9PEZI|nr:hypothetical protein FKW77_010020 [Venturia effusa]